MARLSLDTNILIYAIDPTDAAKHERAKSLVRRAAQGDAALTHQVIGEYLNVLLKRSPEQQRLIRASATLLSSAFPLLQTSAGVLLEAYDSAIRYKLQFWDSLIISVCRTHGVAHFLSEDLQDRQVIDGVTVLNPFNAQNAAAVDALWDTPE